MRTPYVWISLQYSHEDQHGLPLLLKKHLHLIFSDSHPVKPAKLQMSLVKKNYHMGFTKS